MAINFCTLAGSSVNSFCSPSRTVIFNRLSGILHPPRPVTGSAGTSQAPALLQAYRNRYQNQEKPELQFEQENVTVQVTFQGVHGEETQSMAGPVVFVAVTDLKVESLMVSVNITDLKFDYAPY